MPGGPSTLDRLDGGLEGLVRPAQQVPMCEHAGFGMDYDEDCLDFRPGRAGGNSWRCELTGQQWLGDPAPAGWAASPSSGVAMSAPAAPSLSGSPPKPNQVATKLAARRAPGGASVRPLKQSNSISCGQTSVAMAVNALTGKHLTDHDIASKYGLGLLGALNNETRSSGYRWTDGGNFSKKNWASLEKRLNQEHTPVIMGLSGPTFSPSGRGHIVTLLSIDGNKVRYADPADGSIKTTTRQAIEQAPGHPQGKFFFYASKA